MDIIEDNKGYTRFEVARILGARALQLAMGAPTLVKTKKIRMPLELAIIEFENDAIPINVVRE